MLKKEIESYLRTGGRGLKNLTYAYMGVREVKNCQNHAYVINKWPLKCPKSYLLETKMLMTHEKTGEMFAQRPTCFED